MVNTATTKVAEPIKTTLGSDADGSGPIVPPSEDKTPELDAVKPTANDVPADVAALDPISSEVTLSTGTVVTINDLKTRQFFRLMRIVTTGAGHMLSTYRLDGDLSSDEFMGRLLALIVLSVPEAEDEAVEFLRGMCVPNGLRAPYPGQPLSKDAKSYNDSLWAQLYAELENPELEDTIDIISVIVRREAGDIQSLGKKLRKMFDVVSKTGQAT